jgi:predicted AAA+ superfamily ATPase
LYQQIGAHRIKELDLQNYEPLNKEKLQRLWLQGGYPEPLIKGDPFHADWMRYYHDTYLNRDIAALFPRLNHIAYRRFIRLLGNLSGSIINKAEIARGIEVSEKTVNDYFDIAEGTLLWRRIPSFDLNRSKSIIKMPKGHYRDSGLLNHLLKITTGDELYTHPQLGRLFEAWVTEEIIKGLRAARLNQFDIYYYRTRGGAELDLILHGPKGLIPIEIKHGSTVKKQQLISLEAFVHENDCAFGLLVNQGSSVEWIRPKILQCPIGWI